MQIAASPQTMAERADILSVHLALTAATRDFVDSSILERLRPGAYVINTARGAHRLHGPRTIRARA